MTPHLTSQQVAEAMIDGLGGEAERHLAGCPSCQREISQLRGNLALFGGAVRNWSESQQPGTPFIVERPRRDYPSLPTFAVAGIALAMLLLVAVLAGPSHFRPAHPPEGNVTDAALLQQVDAELSRSVPGPMEPLTKLVAVDVSGHQEQNQHESLNP